MRSLAWLLVCVALMGSADRFATAMGIRTERVLLTRGPGGAALYEISLAEAQKLDLAAEKVLLTFPEVKTALAQTGRAAITNDPVGNDNTDILVGLRPTESPTPLGAARAAIVFSEAGS